MGRCLQRFRIGLYEVEKLLAEIEKIAAEAVFYDHDGHRCKKSDAYRVVINEFEKKGKILKNTYGFMKN